LLTLELLTLSLNLTRFTKDRGIGESEAPQYAP
jgi:hypothetical protein